MKKKDESAKLAVSIAQFIFALILLVMILFSFIGCGTTQVLAEKETIEKIIVKDSLIYRDSIVYIPQERIVEIVPQLDTLFMDIETASSKAYLDTTNMLLRGELKSKKKEVVRYQTIIEYRDRVDTVYIKEPQPYEVIKEVKYTPKWAWWSLIGNIIVILYIAFRIYIKDKGVR
jgi:hypothetical protein